MSFRYKEIALGEVCTLGDGAHTKVKRLESGIPYLTSKDIKNGYIDLTSVDYISELDYIKLFGASKTSVRHLQDGDVLVGIIGTLGNCYLYRKGDKFGISSSIAIVRPNKELVYSKFLYQYITSNRFKSYTEAFKGGSVQSYTNLPTLRKIPIYLPPIEEQKSIANILSTLDDKIEVNNKINQKLEEMAQAIFKKWFIDFDFPNEEGKPYKSSGGKMVESELGMIPKGWEVKTIKDFGEVITGKTPSTKKKENYGDKYPFITIPDMHNTMFINTVERYLSEEGHNSQPKKLIPKNSIIVSCIATVGLVGINSIDSHTNQQINSVIPNNERLLPYLYFTIKDKKEYLNLLGSAGTTTKNVNKGLFESIKIVNPKNELIEKFYEMINSSLGKIEKNIVENEKLEKTRDTLLPKLMSGEMRVPINKEN